MAGLIILSRAVPVRQRLVASAWLFGLSVARGPGTCVAHAVSQHVTKGAGSGKLPEPRASPRCCPSSVLCPPRPAEFPPRGKSPHTSNAAPISGQVGAQSHSLGGLGELRSPPLHALSSAERGFAASTNPALGLPASCCCQVRGRECPALRLGTNRAPPQLGTCARESSCCSAVAPHHYLHRHRLSFILVLLLCCRFSSDLFSLKRRGVGEGHTVLQHFSSLPFRSRPQSA